MNLKPKLLLIEDEEDIAELIKLQSDMNGYRLVAASDGLNGFETCLREKPDMVLLDIMLPGQNGLDVCRRMRAHPELKSIPIIMISAKSEETDIVLGLELGADDYVTKPFSWRVLFSRIKAHLRRSGDQESTVKTVRFGDCTIEFDTYLVKKKDLPVNLTLSEFNILQRFVKSTGRVLTRNQLLDAIHEDVFVVDRNIDVHIASLRKKLGPGFDHIETVRGVGYRFNSTLHI